MRNPNSFEKPQLREIVPELRISHNSLMLLVEPLPPPPHLLTISENPLKQLSAGTGLPSCNYNLSEISAANGGVCRG